MASTHAQLKNDFIFSYTTAQAAKDDVLIPVDSPFRSKAAIKFPEYFTSTVWEKHIEIPV